MRFSSRMIAAACGACLVSAVSAGCLQPQAQRRLPVRGRGDTVAVDVLAGQLKLDIKESSPTSVTLHRPGAAVMIFADPFGGVYLNGKAMAPAGPIRSDDGVITITGKMARALMDELAAIPNGAVVNNVEEPAAPAHKGPTIGTVVLDAGHGGRDTGTDAAVKNFGMRLYEKDVNLSITLSLVKLLRRGGVKVYLTRATDTFISLDGRVAISNRLKPDLFVSVHANMLDDSSFRGCMVLVSNSPSGRSVRAAETILRRLTATGLVNRGVRRKNLRVVTNTQAPAVLVETAFLSNRADARILASPAGRAKIASAISAAIIEHLRQPG